MRRSARFSSALSGPQQRQCQPPLPMCLRCACLKASTSHLPRIFGNLRSLRQPSEPTVTGWTLPALRPHHPPAATAVALSNLRSPEDQIGRAVGQGDRRCRSPVLAIDDVAVLHGLPPSGLSNHYSAALDVYPLRDGVDTAEVVIAVDVLTAIQRTHSLALAMHALALAGAHRSATPIGDSSGHGAYRPARVMAALAAVAELYSRLPPRCGMMYLPFGRRFTISPL